MTEQLTFKGQEKGVQIQYGLRVRCTTHKQSWENYRAPTHSLSSQLEEEVETKAEVYKNIATAIQVDHFLDTRCTGPFTLTILPDK